MVSSIYNLMRNSSSLLSQIKYINPIKYNVDRLRSVNFIMNNYFKNNIYDWKNYVNVVDMNNNGYYKFKIYPNIYNNIILKCCIITWAPGAETDIHGHGDYSSMMMPIVGNLHINTYYNNMIHNLLTPDAKYIYQQNKLNTGNISYIDNDIGQHKIINHNNYYTVSIHLYEKPNDNIYKK